MIAKMKFVNITGPKGDIDRVTRKYLLRYPIHLENALSELGDTHSLTPFVEENPYKETVAALKSMAELVNHPQACRHFPEAGGKPRQKGVSPQAVLEDIPANALDTAKNLIDAIREKSEQLTAKKEELQALERRDLKLLREIAPFRGIPFPISRILDFHFIKFRFGRIALNYFDTFSKYVYDNLDTIFYESSRDTEYVWGVYFAPASTFVKVDAIFASMHFERIRISNELTGLPEESYKKVQASLASVRSQLTECSLKLSNIYYEHQKEINDLYRALKLLSDHFDIRKKAACTRAHAEVFYILCGWMEASDVRRLSREIENDSQVDILVEERYESPTASTPTKLRNRGVFRPFQMFVQMYGLPAYNELDPTKFVALTYAFMFGIMFGDVGQGACLVIGGFLLYYFKHMNIAGIISFCGLFSVFFGFMYGSLFGFEHVIPTLWMKPMESENMMTTLILAVCFGVILIIAAMVIQMVNSLRQKNIGAALVGTNGLTGLIFYLIVIYIVVTKLLPAMGPTRFMALLTVLIILCLFAIAFAEPLKAKINKKRFKLHEGPVMFVTEAVFELLEVLLSYMTNSISFIRVGAFALSHAGMMSVVMMLSDIETTATPVGIIIVIFGNILISALEGLIVGIQVLRLEYYEMFSRFYSGTGREFKPYGQKSA